MRRLRSYIALSLPILLASLAACGSDAPPASPSGAGEGTAVPADADPQLAALYQDVVLKEMPDVPFSVLAGAAKEGALTWYHIRLPEAHAAVLKAFQERFPFIHVEEYEDSGAPLNERFISEKRAGRNDVDIIQSTSPIFFQPAIEEGYIEKYVPTSQSAFPEGTYVEGVWYPYGRATQVVYLYNTNLVSPQQAQVLAKFDGFWDPSLASLPVGIGDVPGGASAQLYFWYIHKTYGQASWDAIAARKPLIAGSVPLAEAVATGEVAYAVLSEGGSFNMFLSGAPVAWTTPEPALGQLYPQAVVADAPHPYAARLFQEFTLSEAGQKLFAANSYPSVRANVGDQRTPLLKTSWYNKDPEFFAWDEDEFTEDLEDLTERWVNQFQ